MFAPKVAKPQARKAASSTNSLAPQRSALVAHRPGQSALEQALLLHRTIGNQAMLRLLAQRAGSPTGRESGDQREQNAERLAREAPVASSWDFSKIPVFAPNRTSRPQELSPLSQSPQPGIIQGKLIVGQVNDPLEHEADRVADYVMRMPDPDLSVTSTPPQLSHKCAACEEEVQTLKTARSSESVAGVAPGIVHEVLRSPGQQLDAATRAYFERRFGQDFSNVRVHTNARAAQSAQAVNAHGYTVGQNIVFNAGRFAPGAPEGRRLLAHELTHVVQQGGGVSTANAQTPSPRVSAGAEGAVQRKVKPSPQLEKLAQTAIDELDNGRSKKVLLSTVLAAARLSELPAFAAILRAARNETFGDHFVFLISEMEEDFGSSSTIGILQLFADAGTDIAKLNYSLDPLAAVAKFKSLVQRFKALLNSGDISEDDSRRARLSIAEAEVALRAIEGPSRKPGVQVSQAAGGVAVAAGWAWRAAGALAADDVTAIGVADDVAIPFVIVGAAVLSAIAIFTSGLKPVILDYGPAMAKVGAAVREMTDLLGISVALMATAQLETLSAAEEEAIRAKNAGEPYDPATYNRARQKQIKNEKYGKQRNKQKRGG